MALDVSKYTFIDNQAQSIVSDYLQIDVTKLRQCFAASKSRGIIDQHLSTSVPYMHMLSTLGMIVGGNDESSTLEKRTEMVHPNYLRKLWDSVSISGLIVDDTTNSENTLTLPDLSEASQRPILRCRNIERALEKSLATAENFDDLEGDFLNALFDTTSGDVVALKSTVASRGGLDINSDVKIFQAEFDFTDAKSEFESGKTRIERRPLYDYLLIQALEAAGDYGIPVQFVCGFGDSETMIEKANPALLQPFVRLEWMQNTKFVLLNCYPYVKEAALMCSLYPNVFMDLSISTTMASGAASHMIIDALATAPSSKLLAGTGGHTIPETHWYGALRWKMGLQSALNELILDGMINSVQAGEIAARVLHENAANLYKLGSLA